MENHFTIDLITHDRVNDEFVMYIVEDGPWPDNASDWEVKLRGIQKKIFDATDIAIHGLLYEKYPEAYGKSVRVQVDTPSSEPMQVRSLVDKINEFIQGDVEFKKSVVNSKFIHGLRVVTGHQLGRFQKKNEPTRQP